MFQRRLFPRSLLQPATVAILFFSASSALANTGDFASANTDYFEVESGVLCVSGNFEGTALQNFRGAISENSNYVVIYKDSKRDPLDPNAQTLVIVKKPITIRGFHGDFLN